MNYKKLHKDAQFKKPRNGDAGYDLRAVGSYQIPSTPVMVSTGIALEIPEGHVGLIKERSSMGKRGVAVRGGVIDSSYRGEVKVLLQVVGGDDYNVNNGDKIAQLVIIPVSTPELAEVDELGNTERGNDGFGSTGR